jgi:AbrB family looped-hinge helix DNA binding protein
MITNQTLVKVKNNFQITIPFEIRERIKLIEGDILEVAIKDMSIIFKPKKIIDRCSIDAQIAQGLSDYQNERILGPFKTVKEFKKYIKK